MGLFMLKLVLILKKQHYYVTEFTGHLKQQFLPVPALSVLVVICLVIIWTHTVQLYIHFNTESGMH